MAIALDTIVLDLGTTSIKAAICTDNDQIQTIFSQPAPKISNHKGHYISDAMAYLATVEQLLKKCQQYSQSTSSIGICYQRSSFLIWDSHNGLPVTPLISWQDNRGESSCKELQAQQTTIRQLTGLPLTPYFLAPKLKTLLKQQPELLKGMLNHKLRVGTLDSFLIWHWTAGKHYLTDASMAARTLLMDLDSGLWSETLCDIFNIPLQVLPEICCSNNLDLELKNGDILQTSVADQSAALLASVTINTSEVLVNLGTGGFVVRYEPENLSYNSHHYLRTLVYQDSHKGQYFALEGTLNSIAAALKPYPFDMCQIENLAEIEDIFCLAEPSGIGAPFFRLDIGLEFSSTTDHLTKTEIASLLLEGIIFRIALILEEFNQQSEIPRIYLSGGLSALPCLQQGIALCSPAPVFKLIQKHSSLQGVAILTNNLSSVCYRESTAIPLTDKGHKLIAKYQHWKNWFNQFIVMSNKS